MKTFICHWKKLKKRKEVLLEVLKEEKIDEYEFVTDYDVDDWNIDEIKKEFPKIFELNPKGRKLKYSEISLSLKHIKIINEVAEKYDYALVLEDDVILCDNFQEEFLKTFQQLPENWDLGWAGTCCNLHSYPPKGMRISKTNGSRCTHAYIINNKCAKKILDELKYCNDGADFYYNYLIEKYQLNNYWFEPPLAIQNPDFDTTIQN
jgi:GR25 family glycosyltransferase involved in LPS biosynthesis